MAFQRAQLPAAAGLPQPHRLVLGPAGQLPPVRRPRHAPDPSLMAFQRAQLAAAPGLPQPHRLCHRSPRPACRPSGDHATLRTQSDVPFQRAQRPAASRLPQPHRLVTGARGQVRPSGDHATLWTAACVAFQRAQLAAAAGLPQPHRLVIGARGQRAARPATTPRSRPDSSGPPACAAPRPLPASHSRTVLSPEPEASVRPSGDHATLRTES